MWKNEQGLLSGPEFKKSSVKTELGCEITSKISELDKTGCRNHKLEPWGCIRLFQDLASPYLWFSFDHFILKEHEKERNALVSSSSLHGTHRLINR